MFLPDNTFPSAVRLKKRREFIFVQNTGRRFKGEHLLLSIVPNNNKATQKIGITITTKIHKRSTHRNKLKRRIRELFRHSRESFPSLGFECVVIALKGATELSFDELQTELCSLRNKAERFFLKNMRAQT